MGAKFRILLRIKNERCETNPNDVVGCRKKLSQCARHAGQIVGSLWMMIELFLSRGIYS